jgi:hypothetical protein
MTWDVFVCVELAMQRPHKAYPVELAQSHSEIMLNFCIGLRQILSTCLRGEWLDVWIFRCEI